MTEIGKAIIADLTSDNDEKKAEDINAVANFLEAEGVAMTDGDKPNIVYMKGIYLVKAVQRKFFNATFAKPAEDVAVEEEEEVQEQE